MFRGKVRHSRNADGNLIKGLLDNDVPFTASYDAENRLTDITFTRGGTLIKETFSYGFNHLLARYQHFESGSLTRTREFVRLGHNVVQYGKYVANAIGGIVDFAGNYNDMRDANTIGGDKYFLCKANCEAAPRGEGGRDIARCISDSCEWVVLNIKGDPVAALVEDQIANNYERDKSIVNNSGECRLLCEKYRLNGFSSQY